MICTFSVISDLDEVILVKALCSCKALINSVYTPPSGWVVDLYEVRIIGQPLYLMNPTRPDFKFLLQTKKKPAQN